MGADEKTDLINILAKHRGFLRQTVRGLDDEQAARTTTVSSLCLGGIVKHVSAVEDQWRRFVVEGPSAFPPPADYAGYAEGFRMLPGETLAGILARYEETEEATNDLIRPLPSLDADQPLPVAPWFEPGARWTARRVFLHILAETSQHAGHADIIRESLDGARTMG